MPLDFPSSPTNGQVYGNYYYNSARGAWNALLPAATPNFFTNAQLIDATATSSTASATPLIVKGASGQTADLQKWEDNAGTDLITFSSNGAISTTASVTVSGTGVSTQLTTNNLNFSRNSASYLTNTTIGGLLIHSTTRTTSGDTQVWSSSANGGLVLNPAGQMLATATPLTVKASASQTADLQQWQSSTGAVLSEINSAGELQVPRIGVGSVMPTTTRLMTTASTATEIPLLVRGAESQSTTLQQWQNSAGSAIAYVGQAGEIVSTDRLIGTTPNNAGSTGGLISKAPSGGTQTSAYIQFVNNAHTVQWGAIEATSANVMNLSASQVRMPSQPSFQATKTDAHATSSQYLVFNNVLHNIGNAYNSSNGRFTAPVAGRYLINFSTLLWNMGSASNVYLYVNQAQQQFMGTYGQFTGSYAGQGASAVVNLNANDYIQLYFQHNGTNLHSGYTVASGYLLG